MDISGNRTIVDLFRENADRVPDRPFVRYAGRELSYWEMDAAAGQVAAALGSAGIGYRSRVALAIGNRPAFLAAFLGILRCGATAVPLNSQYRADEFRYALEHARCEAVFTEENLRATVKQACTLAGHGISVMVADDQAESRFVIDPGPSPAASPGRRPAKPSAGDLAGIFYTSGTTSRPKGVMITHGNMLYSAEVTIKSLGIGEGDVPLLAFPLFHVNSLFYGVLTAIVLQGAIGLETGFSVSGYWQGAVRSGATWTPGITGPLVQLLLDREESPEESQHAMRLAVGGNFRSLEQIRAFRERFGVTLLPGWSMTETVSLGSLHPVSRPAPIPAITGIGYPTLGQEIRLVRDDGSEAAAGEPGEILYKSPSMFAGYLDDPDATRAALTPDGWLRTGDVACRDAGGYLAFMDRKKEMIKTKGENVAAAEVERALNEHPEVLESAAVGVPDEQGTWGERIEAFVVRAADSELGAEELVRWVGQRLAEFKVPGSIHFVERLPKTALGKIQRQRLRRK